MGRALVEGAKEVRLFSETIKVEADVVRLEGMSGHADKKGLSVWAEAFKDQPEKFFIVHGEDETCDNFAQYLESECGRKAEAPYSGDIFDLAAGEWELRVAPKKVPESRKGTRRANAVFARLLAAGERLMSVIRKSEGGANKDLARFADQINALCDKWER